jgi:hypothetical protein
MEARPEVVAAFVHGHFDRSPVGGFSYSVLAAAHEMERKMTGLKIGEAKRRAKALGLPVGEVAAGYKWAGDGRDRSSRSGAGNGRGLDHRQRAFSEL